MGARHAGEQWVCVLGGHGPVVVDADGGAELEVSDGGLSVYAPAAAESELGAQPRPPRPPALSPGGAAPRPVESAPPAPGRGRGG